MEGSLYTGEKQMFSFSKDQPMIILQFFALESGYPTCINPKPSSSQNVVKAQPPEGGTNRLPREGQTLMLLTYCVVSHVIVFPFR